MLHCRCRNTNVNHAQPQEELSSLRNTVPGRVGGVMFLRNNGCGLSERRRGRAFSELPVMKGRMVVMHYNALHRSVFRSVGNCTLAPPLRILSLNSRGFRSIAGVFKTQEFLLAAVGEGISEVEVVDWHVKVGDSIAQFDKVCDVQTDKATVEITSRFDGVVKSINYKPGDIAKVGTSLLTLESEQEEDTVEEEIKQEETVVENQKNSDEIPMTQAQTSASILTVPAVRRLAKENGIDLGQVKGSGVGGRIMKEDILKFIASGKQSGTITANPTPAQVPKRLRERTVDAPVSIPSSKKTEVQTDDKVHKIIGMQRVMVKTMSDAAKVPALGLCEEIQMQELINFRNVLKKEAENLGVKLTFLPLLMKCASAAILEFPIINSHVNDECTEYVTKGAHNIGIAMDTPKGLVVPNIKNVQNKSIFEIAQDLNRLQELGKAGKLGVEELNGGTFTLSNIGSIGGTYASPILFLPQVVIGALGRLQTLPRYDRHGQLQPSPIMQVSWSADHRIIDGASITRFSNAFKRYIENPTLLMLHSR